MAESTDWQEALEAVCVEVFFGSYGVDLTLSLKDGRTFAGFRIARDLPDEGQSGVLNWDLGARRAMVCWVGGGRLMMGEKLI